MMSKRFLWLLLSLLLWSGTALAQDGIDLPAPLFVLTNNGQVQRIGLGAEGLTIVTPEDVFIIDFGLSPDGQQMAYRTPDGLFILTLETGESSAIEAVTADLPSVRGLGDTLAWSPAGDAIAYTTSYGGRAVFLGDQPTFINLAQGAFLGLSWSSDGSYLAAEAEASIWWIFRREALNLVLTSAIPSSLGLGWYNDAALLFAPAEGGLYRMDLASANAQTMLLDDTWVYALPVLQADGVIAVFGREKTDDTVPTGSGRLIGLPPDAPRIDNLSETVFEFAGLRWGPGGLLMLALRESQLSLVLPRSSLSFVLPLEEVVAYAWGAPQTPNSSP